MKKILTIILDGFGLRNEVHGNAVKLAKMPNFVSLWNNYPHCQLMASEQYVGLTKHQMGNSEVGHQTIGAGRLVKQNFMQIEDWFLNDEISKNLEFKNLVDYAKSTNKPIHMMGLLSDGGIHSHIEFFERMIEVLHKNDVSSEVQEINDKINEIKEKKELLNEQERDKNKANVFGKYRVNTSNDPMSFDELKELDPTQNGQSTYGNHGRSEEYERIEITEDQTKQCPKSGHRINFSSAVCPYCGTSAVCMAAPSSCPYCVAGFPTAQPDGRVFYLSVSDAGRSGNCYGGFADECS